MIAEDRQLGLEILQCVISITFVVLLAIKVMTRWLEPIGQTKKSEVVTTMVPLQWKGEDDGLGGNDIHVPGDVVDRQEKPLGVSCPSGGQHFVDVPLRDSRVRWDRSRASQLSLYGTQLQELVTVEERCENNF
jgi:hypothetical protein